MTERIVTDSNGRKHITNEPLLHSAPQQQAEPQRSGITAAQVEKLKRLADEVEDSVRSVVEAEYTAMGDPSLKYKRQQLDEDRAALHAALDALVKGE